MRQLAFEFGNSPDPSPPSAPKVDVFAGKMADRQILPGDADIPDTLRKYACVVCGALPEYAIRKDKQIELKSAGFGMDNRWWCLDHVQDAADAGHYLAAHYLTPEGKALRYACGVSAPLQPAAAGQRRRDQDDDALPGVHGGPASPDEAAQPGTGERGGRRRRAKGVSVPSSEGVGPGHVGAGAKVEKPKKGKTSLPGVPRGSRVVSPASLGYLSLSRANYAQGHWLRCWRCDQPFMGALGHGQGWCEDCLQLLYEQSVAHREGQASG